MAVNHSFQIVDSDQNIGATFIITELSNDFRFCTMSIFQSTSIDTKHDFIAFSISNCLTYREILFVFKTGIDSDA